MSSVTLNLKPGKGLKETLQDFFQGNICKGSYEIRKTNPETRRQDPLIKPRRFYYNPDEGTYNQFIEDIHQHFERRTFREEKSSADRASYTKIEIIYSPEKLPSNPEMGRPIAFAPTRPEMGRPAHVALLQQIPLADPQRHVHSQNEYSGAAAFGGEKSKVAQKQQPLQLTVCQTICAVAIGCLATYLATISTK